MYFLLNAQLKIFQIGIFCVNFQSIVTGNIPKLLMRAQRIYVLFKEMLFNELALVRCTFVAVREHTNFLINGYVSYISSSLSHPTMAQHDELFRFHTNYYFVFNFKSEEFVSGNVLERGRNIFFVSTLSQINFFRRKKKALKCTSGVRTLGNSITTWLLISSWSLLCKYLIIHPRRGRASLSLSLSLSLHCLFKHERFRVGWLLLLLLNISIGRLSLIDVFPKLNPARAQSLNRFPNREAERQQLGPGCWILNLG